MPGFCHETGNDGKSWSWMNKRNPRCPSPKRKLDIIFVLDGSYSVKDNFNDIKRWTRNMASRFDLKNGTTQIGVVQYSNWNSRADLNNQKFITTEIKLGEHTSLPELKKAVNRIKRKGTLTNTAHALNKTVLDFMASPRWSEENTTKVLVLLTDGRASDSKYLEDSAKYVRSLGIIPFAIGVGKFNITELKIVATGDLSSESRVTSVQSFSGLDAIVEELTSQILKIVLEGAGSTTIASYKLEMGQNGFSMKSSPQVGN